MTTTPDAGAAGEAVTEAVQAAAKPVGFIAALAALALGVAWLVQRYGKSLPVPSYNVTGLVVDVDDEDQDDEDQEDD